MDKVRDLEKYGNLGESQIIWVGSVSVDMSMFGLSSKIFEIFNEANLVTIIPTL